MGHYPSIWLESDLGTDISSFSWVKSCLFPILEHSAVGSCHEGAVSVQLRLNFSERWTYQDNIEKSKSPVAF